MERTRRFRLTIGAVVVAGVALGGWWVWPAGPTGEMEGIPGTVVPYAVEVVNGTRVDGLARRVTRRLREAGIDVVYYGSHRTDTLRTTQLLLRRGDSAVGEAVRRRLGFGTLVVALDPQRLVDVTVVLGLDASSETRN